MKLLLLIAAVRSLKTPCDSCRMVAKGLKKEMEKSAKSNFGGGNTKWEEKSLGAWATSETRFEHCIEYACYGNGKDDSFTCNNFVEKYEEDIEQWFKSGPEQNSIDFIDAVCVNVAAVCCAKETQYGPDCLECQVGVNGEVCSGRGKCEGGGDRKGKGGCKCDYNYKGDVCSLCKNTDFFLKTEASETDKPECSRCHYSCLNGCTGEGAKKCAECASKFAKVIDAEDETQFECVKCDRACRKECTGPGPGACDECASGFELTTDDESGLTACTEIPKPTTPPTEAPDVNPDVSENEVSEDSDESKDSHDQVKEEL